jgi:hypothetical protein
VTASCTLPYRGLSSFVPSLALLSEQLLGQALRGRDPSAPQSTSQQQLQHDSREDASVALALVKLELQRGAPSPLLDPPDLKVTSRVRMVFAESEIFCRQKKPNHESNG